jgi:hypothetical protein
MSTGTPSPVQPTPATPPAHRRARLVESVYGHSLFFYWWPVWAVGYVMALLTWIKHNPVTIGGQAYLVHPSPGLGVIYTFVFFVVIMLTNFTLRGMASAIAILVALLLVVVAAYFEWWETLLGWLGDLTIYMNMGFYVFFSTMILIVWIITVFFFDRLVWWKVVPGQLTQERLVGSGMKSYDTRGIVFEKIRQDLFRHWLLGLGSGDLKITLPGQRDEIYIPNVLFVDTKVRRIQALIATRIEVEAKPGV